MATTPNMNLSLPTVSVTLGPDWATQINTALETVDSHDHSNGKGSKITPSGLLINTNLDITNNIFYNFKSVRFQEQSATLTGSSNSNSLHSVNGNLYFTNGSGIAVQLTSGSGISSSPGSASIFATVEVAANLTIGNTDTFVYLIVDTTISRTITLPLAANVSPGRLYIIKDSSGNSEAFNITINAQGSDVIDGTSSVSLNSNYGSWIIVGDGSSKWYIS